MFTTKKLHISQNLYYITVLRFKQNFFLTSKYFFWAYLWFSISTQVSQVNNLDFFGFKDVCPHISKTHRSISHRYISRRLRCRGSIRLSSILRQYVCNRSNSCKCHLGEYSGAGQRGIRRTFPQSFQWTKVDFFVFLMGRPCYRYELR
jgi:hypothetical protein